MTSPWATGRQVEHRYARAIATALRSVCDVHLGWYFLHVDQESPTVDPRIMQLAPDAGRALVSLVSGGIDYADAYDFAWRTQFGEPAVIDTHLTVDGSAGRLYDRYCHGSPLTVHTHWQSLFANGTGAGLAAFEELGRRINSTWGTQIRWTSARELATYSAARAATRAVVSDGDGTVMLTAPFPCPSFTFSMPLPQGTTGVLYEGVPLEHLHVDGQEPMQEGTWYPRDGRVHVCVALHDGARLTWQRDV